MKKLIPILGALLAAACSSGTTDVCAGHSGACLDLTITSATIKSLDTVRFTATGVVTGTKTSALGHAATLPVHVAVRFTAATAGALHLDVDGLLAGALVGQGTLDRTLTANQHATAVIALTAPITPMRDMAGPVDDLAAVDLQGAADAASAPPDLSGADLTAGPDLATFCVAGAGHLCVDANTLERCLADGSAFEQVACAHGCGANPAPHCKLVTPTGIAPVDDFNTPGVMDKTLTSVILHSDTGQIEGGMRAASGDPSTMSVLSGIGFHVVTSGGNTVGVFVFNKLTLNGTIANPLKVVGSHSVVLLAQSDVSIQVVNAAADQTANTPGPGGFAGAIPSVPDGLGPGGGKAGGEGGGSPIPRSGAGGGGHGAAGGPGADNPTPPPNGGVGGVAYDGASLAILRGGSGGGSDPGGAANGGAGGGAIQIVSQTTIAITGGIVAGGAGGRGDNVGNTCGGGGAGGTILLEAPTVSVADSGYLMTGGGGGGGTDNGNAGGIDPTDAVAGAGGLCFTGHCGGAGGLPGHVAGLVGTNNTAGPTVIDGCGGGAVGRIGINTLTGAATLSATSTLYIPTVAQTAQFVQGLITIQ